MTDYYYRENKAPVKNIDYDLTLHREDGPAIESSEKQEWWLNGKLHREDGPAVIYFDKKGKTIRSEYFLKGLRHRLDGPAYEDFNNVYECSYYQNDLLHREDGPAEFGYYDENKTMLKHQSFFVNGVPRSSLPYFIHYSMMGKITEENFYYPENLNSSLPMILEFKNGLLVTQYWGKAHDFCHREDGPAIVKYQNGKIVSEEWLKENLLFREGGYPCRVYYNDKESIVLEMFSSKEKVFDGGAHERAYYPSGKIQKLRWHDEKGRLHRTDGPALILFTEEGEIESESWFLEGKEI